MGPDWFWFCFSVDRPRPPRRRPIFFRIEFAGLPEPPHCHDPTVLYQGIPLVNLAECEIRFVLFGLRGEWKVEPYNSNLTFWLAWCSFYLAIVLSGGGGGFREGA